MLEFALLKIINKVASRGINIKSLFNSWDKDGNSHLDAEEIIHGIEKDFSISLKREETISLSKYLDKNNDGRIDFDEFKTKINLEDYREKSFIY